MRKPRLWVVENDAFDGWLPLSAAAWPVRGLAVNQMQTWRWQNPNQRYRVVPYERVEPKRRKR